MATKIHTLASSTFPESTPRATDWFEHPVGVSPQFNPKFISTPVKRPGFDRFCPNWTLTKLKSGESHKIYHAYAFCDCPESEIIWTPIVHKYTGRPNTLSEFVAVKGLETGLSFPEPELKPIPKRKGKKSAKQQAKSKAFQFTIKEAAFPSVSDEPVLPPTEIVWKKKKFSRLSIVPEDLVQESDELEFVPLTKETLDAHDEVKALMELNKYYEDNGHLDEPDHLDGPSTAISFLMKLLPDAVVQGLEQYDSDPLEIVTALLGISGYITTLAAMTKQENNTGVKVGMSLMAIDYLHQIYKIVERSWVITTSFEELSSALTMRMSDLEKSDEFNFEFNLKVAKTISAIGCFMLSLFGISPAKQMTDFLTFRKASDETFDLLTLLLWECLEIDVKGDKLLVQQIKILTDEGVKFEQMLTQHLWGKNLEDAESWTTRAIALDRALHKSASDSRLKGMIAKITNLISEARKADAGNTVIPAPACMALYGPPGLGKSLFANYVLKQLSNHFGTDDRTYDLNTGRHFGHYSNQQWGIYDEFGATKEASENSIMPILNQVLSGNSANMAGAAVEDKHQYSKFTGVVLISNKEPRMLELGLTAEAKAAFVTRLIYTEVTDPTYNPNFTRDNQAGRKPDFSHLRCHVWNPDGSTTSIRGDRYYLHVAKVIQTNQDNFMRRKDMFGKGAQVAKMGRLVRDYDNESWFDNAPQPRAETTENELMEDMAFIVAGDVDPEPIDPNRIPTMEFRNRNRGAAPRTVTVNMDSSAESLDDMEDTLDASIGRTLWICGPPGNGKTQNIVPFIKRYAQNTDTELVDVRKPPGSKFWFKKPKNSVGVIYILDDVVDPTTKEGQEAYAAFFDEHIAPTNSTAIIISNYGPEQGIVSRMTGSLASLFFTSRQYTPTKVIVPAFGRRAGWTSDGGSMTIVTDDKLSFFNQDGSTVVVDEFITSYLSGVIGDSPINIHETLPGAVPFTQDEADLWFDLANGANATTILRHITQAASPRALQMSGLLSKINLDQFDIKVGVNIYKAMLEKIPDVKIKVSVGNVVLIGHGKDLYISKASASPYSVSFQGTACFVETVYGNVVITKEDYMSFLTKSLIPNSKGSVAIFNALSHTESLDPENWARVEAHFPLTFSEALSISNKKMVASVLKQKNMILGTLGLGAMVTTFALVLKYALSSDTDQVKIAEDTLEAARAGTQIRVKSRQNGKKPMCSDTDKFDDEADKHEYDYAYDELRSADAKMDYVNGDMYITKTYNYKGKNKTVRYNTKTKMMNYGTELDYYDAAYLDLGSQDSAQESFVKSLNQNVVIVKSGILQSYGTMLSSQIGIVPLHTVIGSDDCRASWLNPDTNTYVEAKIKRIYECPDREMCFFALINDEGYGVQGPFKDLYKKLLGIPDISQVTRASMMVPNAMGGIDLLMGQFKLEATIQHRLNVQTAHHWTTDVGYIHYGALNLPVMRGRCGLPYFSQVGGKFFILGVHAVSRPHYSKIGAVVCSTELWNEMQEEVEKAPLPEAPADVLESQQEDSFDAVLSNYVRTPTFDKISNDDHAVFETYIPKQVMELERPITDEMLHPHGPGTVLVSGIANKKPYDTKAQYKNMNIEGMSTLFKTEKVPTLSEEEILRDLSDKVTADAKGNKHVAYTRLAANSENTGTPGISEEIKELSEELADFMIEEMGKESETVRPLSVQEAISGTHTTPTFKRESAAGGLLGSVFGYSKKVDFVDYDEKTREITWKGVHGRFIERWTNDQYEMAKDLVRLHIPCTAGLKSEKLLFKKLHKKRVFMITSLPTWINQKRILLPIQNLFTKYDKTEFTRFPLVFDPIVDSNDMCNWLYEGTEVGASFDWQSFDLTVDANLLHGVGYFVKRVYDRLGPIGNRLGNVAICLMQDMAAGSFILGKSWLRTMGGVESGSGCTSLIDVLIVMTALFCVIFEMLREQQVQMTRREIFKRVKTLHGGDDLKVAVTKAFGKLINLTEMCKRIKDKFGMVLTLDTKDEGEMKWRPFNECSFLSRHFIKHPTFPVWLSKLKEESVGSILNWTNAVNPHQQARQIEMASVEVFPYGEEVYNTYRTNCMRHFKAMNIPVDIPSYAQTSERLGTAILTKEHPAEFEERFLLESSVASVKKQTRSVDLKHVVKTKQAPNTTMPAKTIKTAFIKTLMTSADIADLILTPEFAEMAAYGARQLLPTATVTLKDKSRVMSVPRNTPSLWSYIEFLTNSSIEMDRSTIASFAEFCKQWEKVNMDNCHTQSTKWLKNIYYLFAKDSRFSFDELKKWTHDDANKDSLDSGSMQGHFHACVLCGELYHHTHSLRNKIHKQFPNQCTNNECEWFQGEETDLLKVVSYKAKSDRFAEVRWARQLLIATDSLDVAFAMISLTHGNLTPTAELICRAGLSKAVRRWFKNQILGEDQLYVERLMSKYGRTENMSIMFPGYFETEDAMAVDHLDSAPAGDILPMANTAGGKAPTGAGTGPTTSNQSGHSATDITSNLSAAGTAEVVQPAAVTTGAAANDTILTSFGGLPVDMLPMGGYVNSLLAFVYNPIPLATIAISADTVEYATLYSWKINPFSEECVGPYTKKWADMHDRFAGGFYVGLQVSTSSVIIGKIGIYHVPSGVTLPTNMTRTNMEIFDHTIIDLYAPSSNQLHVRPTTQDKFFVTKATQYQDWGQIIVMAYTAVSNVIGGAAATAPPVYPTICCTEDAVYSLPILTDAGEQPYDIPPVPPMGTFFTTEGHNVDPLYFPNTQKAVVTADGVLSPQWMTTSGRVKTEVSTSKGENQMSFYWGDRWGKSTYASQQSKIGNDNSNPHRYELEFVPEGDTVKFTGIRSIAPEANIGRTYNANNSTGLAGTDQYAQVFKEEEKIETINYISADFKLMPEPNSAAWWGAFDNQGTETPTEVKITQFGDSPSEIRVRQLTREAINQRSKFFEIRAQNLGVSSGANIPAPVKESLKNPAGFGQGPEVSSDEFNRKVPDISLLTAVVCNSSLPTTGQNVPPGYRLISFWDDTDVDNWFGLPAVLPGVQGITAPMSAKGAEFKKAVKIYLDRTQTKSYVLRVTSTASSMTFDILVNQFGAFVFNPEQAYGVIPTKTDSFYTRYLSSDRSQDWMAISRPSEGLFQSRISITRKHPGFMLDHGNFDYVSDLPEDTLDSGLQIGSIYAGRAYSDLLPEDFLDSGLQGGLAIGGGLLTGIGQGMTAWSDRSFQKEMQRNRFAQEKKMQASSLAAQTAMNNRTNEAREYGSRKSADAQEYSANRTAQGRVEAEHIRVIGGNNVSTIFG